MPKILFIEANGTEHQVDAEPGESIMQVAIGNLIPGIIADCGGSCACGTCHAYLDESWLDKVPPRDEEESAMLEYTLDVQPNSRLTCQVTVTDELDGIVFRLPASQG